MKPTNRLYEYSETSINRLGKPDFYNIFIKSVG